MSRLSSFDFRKFLSLGREASEKHQEFKYLAPLGNDYAKKRAALEFMFWLRKHPTASLNEKLLCAVDLLGKAELLHHVKEVMRVCLALGDTSHKEDWERLE